MEKIEPVFATATAPGDGLVSAFGWAWWYAEQPDLVFMSTAMPTPNTSGRKMTCVPLHRIDIAPLVQGKLFEAVALNHQWHQLYDEYGGYPDSHLCETNMAALNLPVQPIDMVLYCPMCGVQHIDGPELHPVGCAEPCECKSGECAAVASVWQNPPHRSHLCDACGHIWRPADVPTNGVQQIRTHGAGDSPFPGTMVRLFDLKGHLIQPRHPGPGGFSIFPPAAATSHFMREHMERTEESGLTHHASIKMNGVNHCISFAVEPELVDADHVVIQCPHCMFSHTLSAGTGWVTDYGGEPREGDVEITHAITLKIAIADDEPKHQQTTTIIDSSEKIALHELTDAGITELKREFGIEVGTSPSHVALVDLPPDPNCRVFPMPLLDERGHPIGEVRDVKIDPGARGVTATVVITGGTGHSNLADWISRDYDAAHPAAPREGEHDE